MYVRNRFPLLILYKGYLGGALDHPKRHKRTALACAQNVADTLCAAHSSRGHTSEGRARLVLGPPTTSSRRAPAPPPRRNPRPTTRSISCTNLSLSESDRLKWCMILARCTKRGRGKILEDNRGLDKILEGTRPANQGLAEILETTKKCMFEIGFPF